MDHKGIDKRTTVQGRDTPVPVRGMSGRAGSPGPSASDRSAPSVASQADGGYKVTGKGAEGESTGSREVWHTPETGKGEFSPFNRSRKLARTPPQARGFSLPDRLGEKATALRPEGSKEEEMDVLACTFLSPEREGGTGNEHGKAGGTPGVRQEYGRDGSAPDITMAGGTSRCEEEEESDDENHTTTGGADAAERPTLKKRKGSTTSDSKTEAIRQIISEMGREIRLVGEIAKERNTKKEIKSAAKKLLQLLPKIMREEAAELIASGTTSRMPTTGENLREHITRQRFEDLERENRRLGKLIENLQRENREIKNQLAKRETTGDGAVEALLDEDSKSWEGCSDIICRRIPENTFRNAFWAAGTPLDAKPNTDLLILTETGRGAERNREIREALEKRYPEIVEDELVTLAASISVTFKDREGKKVTNSRWILRAEAETDNRRLYEDLVKIRTLMVEFARTKLAVYPPGSDPKGETMRNMPEYVFRSTSVKCLVYVKDRTHTTKTEERGAGGGRPRPAREKEVLILKQEGKPYNEILRSVKEAVLPKTEAAKAVKTLRRTRDGAMLIVLEKGMEENREQLKRELAKIHQGKIVERGGGSEIRNFRITELDSEVTREEVTHALNVALGETAGDALIDDLRPAYGGTQIATIKTGKEGARKLESTDRLRIGLSWCPVSERVEVVRCYKCWGYGHRSFECKAGEDYSKACVKCGGPGHIAKDCAGAEKCLTCKVEGHRAGSGRCPEFRKALSRERLLKKKKKAY